MARKLTQDAKTRQDRLLQACLSSPTGSIGFLDVETYYRSLVPVQEGHPAGPPTEVGNDGEGTKEKGKKKRQRTAKEVFEDDCSQLVKNIDWAADLVLQFRLPTPKLQYSPREKRLSVVHGHRRFSRLWADELATEKDRRKRLDALAAYVAGAGCWPDSDGREPLVPRGRDAVFIGFGTTTFAIALEMLKHRHYDQLTLYTTSFEIAGEYYYRHPAAAQTDSPIGLHLGEHYGLDWVEGAIEQAELPRTVHTAVISCDRLDPSGAFFSEAKYLPAVANQFLAKAARIVIVADRDKLGQTGGSTEINLAQTKARIVLVTNEPYDPDKYKLRMGILFRDSTENASNHRP